MTLGPQPCVDIAMQLATKKGMALFSQSSTLLRSFGLGVDQSSPLLRSSGQLGYVT